MRPPLVIALAIVALGACTAEAPGDPGPEPMRPAENRPRPPPRAEAPARVDEALLPELAPVVLPDRPRADPDIERALDIISASGLRFVDPPSDPDARPNEYTAEQFAAKLRTKWDWIGYDLTELDPWLDEIATRSFRTNLPYQIELANGTTGELRAWLDQQLQP